MLGGGLGAAFLHAQGFAVIYQFHTPEALLWACGRGFRHPGELTAALAEFLQHFRAPAFDCASLPAGMATSPAAPMALAQPWLTWAAALLWRGLGPTQVALWPLAAALHAAYAAGAFRLARLFLGRSAAVLLALVVTLSPVALSMLLLLRDFSKAPFFLWALALLVLAARAEGARRAAPLAAGAGVVAGIGFGFRADLLILLPLGVLFLSVAGRGARAAAAAAFGVALLAAAAPVLLAGKGGGLVGVYAMQGATEPFRAWLALRPAPYALGHLYSDELTLSAIAASERPRRLDWDAREPGPNEGPSQAMVVAAANLLEWAPSFAADFAAQGLKAAGWVLGFPTLVSPDRRSAHAAQGPVTAHPWITDWQWPIYRAVGQAWLPLLGLAGVLALLLRVAARRPWEAVGLALLLLGLCAYPALQFAVRHMFHLEFVWLLGLLSIPAALREWRLLAPTLPRFALAAAAGLGSLGVAYLGLARWQQARLGAEFAALLAVPREVVPAGREALPGGAVLLRVAVPQAHRAVAEGPPDSMNDRLPAIGPAHSAIAGGERMLLTLGGAACAPGPAAVGLRYAPRPGVWQPLDSTLAVRPGDLAVFPALYRGTQSFAGVALPASHAGCEARIERVALTRGLPLVLTAVLPPGWEALPLRKGLGRFAPERPE